MISWKIVKFQLNILKFSDFFRKFNVICFTPPRLQILYHRQTNIISWRFTDPNHRRRYTSDTCWLLFLTSGEPGGCNKHKSNSNKRNTSATGELFTNHQIFESTTKWVYDELKTSFISVCLCLYHPYSWSIRSDFIGIGNKKEMWRNGKHHRSIYYE